MISKKQKENEFWQELIFGLTIFYPLPVCLRFPKLMQKGTRPHYIIYAFYNTSTRKHLGQGFLGFKYEISFFLLHGFHISEHLRQMRHRGRGPLLLLNDDP